MSPKSRLSHNGNSPWKTKEAYMKASQTSKWKADFFFFSQHAWLWIFWKFCEIRGNSSKWLLPQPQKYCSLFRRADSLRPHGLQPARLLWPRDSPGKNTGVGCHFLLQGNIPDPGIESTSPVSPAMAGGSLSHWAIQRIWSLSFQIFPFAFCLTLMTLSTSCFGFLSFFLGSCFSPNSGKALPVTSFESYLFSSFAHRLFSDWWDVRPFSPVISPTCIFLQLFHFCIQWLLSILWIFYSHFLNLICFVFFHTFLKLNICF